MKQGWIEDPIWGRSVKPTSSERVTLRAFVATMPVAMVNALNARLKRQGKVIAIVELES